MNKFQAQQNRRPAATVGPVKGQTRPAGRLTAITATAAPRPASLTRGNTSGGGAIIK